MNTLKLWSARCIRTARRLLRDEQGGEVLEYALVAGLIIIGALAVIGTVGTKVLARWQAVDAGL